MSSASAFRRTVVGLCLVLGPLLLLVATFVIPDEGEEEAEEYLATIADETGRAEAGAILFYLGFVLLTVGIFGIIHLLRNRAVVLGHIGGVLAVVGAISFAALVATTFYDIALAESPDREAAVAIYDSLEDTAGFFVVLIPALIGTALGLLLLAIGLWRARIAPVWVPIVVLAGLVLVSIGTDLVPVAIGNALLLAALGYVGAKVLGMGNDEWERGPDPRGELSGGAPPTAAA